MKSLFAAAAAVCVLFTAAPAAASAEPDLAAVRAAAERFRDVNVALAEGYVRDPLNLCDTAAMMGRPAELGAMGIHFFRPDLLGRAAHHRGGVAKVERIADIAFGQSDVDVAEALGRGADGGEIGLGLGGSRGGGANSEDRRGGGE